MFERVLVANRGEIACRVISTLQEHGIRSIAVFSDIDTQALHVEQADQALPIGKAEPRHSYLNIEAILAAATKSRAQAIHPGYGFLAENAEFAGAVEAAGLTYIGPSAEQARIFGDKRSSREVARRANVPVVPGYEHSGQQDGSSLRGVAREIGYPVIVKAALGGGGKGMQLVPRESDLEAALESASRLGATAFGDDSVYLEKALVHPRHVEVQIFGDGQGNGIHLFERECSLQRRHQKVIEETPSPGISQETRQELLAAALRLVKETRYRGAGTVEFLVTPEGKFYFLEMNTRLQVEHPITEWVTGLDLVWQQLQVAATGKIPITQEEVQRNGHAVEARLYAEDPGKEFLPQAGDLTLVSWHQDESVRIDAGVVSGATVPVHYDPILAKVSCWGETRAQAYERLAAALDGSAIHGVITNIDLLRGLARDPSVLKGEFSTEYLEKSYLEGFLNRMSDPANLFDAVAAAAIALQAGLRPFRKGRDGDLHDQSFADPFSQLGSWRLPGLTPS